MSKTPYALLVDSAHLKKFLVQIRRIDQKYVEVSEFSTFQECQIMRDVLYLRGQLLQLFAVALLALNPKLSTLTLNPSPKP